jgi:hypothetical protein
MQVSEVLEQWIALQRTWMYLEPIFGSEDIMQQLPLEGKRFATVDRTWRKTLDAAKRSPGLLKVSSVVDDSCAACHVTGKRQQQTHMSIIAPPSMWLPCVASDMYCYWCRLPSMVLRKPFQPLMGRRLAEVTYALQFCCYGPTGLLCLCTADVWQSEAAGPVH